MSKHKIFAMIPARYGSTRLKMKNLALINGKPMIRYAIIAAKASNIFDSVVVNSEHKIFSKIAERYNVNFYQRPEKFGSSQVKADSVVADFMEKHHDADIVAWINPTSPLQTAKEIHDVIEYFIDEDLDSLITVEDKYVHSIFDGEPVNYKQHEVFTQTQDLKPVKTFVYSVMMWRRSVFLKSYNNTGHALFCGKFGTYAVSKNTGLIIKTQEDLDLVDRILRSDSLLEGGVMVQYDSLVDRE